MTPRFDISARRRTPLFWVGLAIAAIVVLMLSASLYPKPLPHRIVDADFANYWVAAQLALEGRSIDLFSGQDVYFAHLQSAFGANYPWHNWSYPPHYLLLIAPLGLFDYLPAATLFLALTLALYLHAAALACGRLDRLGSIFVFTFVLLNIVLIQNGFLTAALMLYGLALRDKRPLLSGLCFGLLTVKPQLGLLLPILLLFEARFRVIAAAMATVAVMVAISILAFGTEAWIGYIANNLPYQNDVMMRFTGTFVAMMPSTLGALRVLGAEPHIASIAQWAISIAALAIYIWSLIRFKAPDMRAASTVLATFLVSPYALNYDLGALAVFAAAAYGLANGPAEDRAAQASYERLSLMALALLPIGVLPLGAAGAPLSPIILALGWVGMARFYQAKNSGNHAPSRAESRSSAASEAG